MHTLMTATALATSKIVVRIPRRVDALIVPAMSQDLDGKIQEGTKIILDFSQTSFIEIEATDVFLECLVRATQRNAKIALRGVRPSVRTSLERGGVLEYFRRIR